MGRVSEEFSDCYAHSVEGEPDTSQWEVLEVHLREVANLAARFSSAFAAHEWGMLAGLWHDLGKYSQRFQDYLRTVNGLEAHIEQHSKVDHSTAGAQHAHRTIPNLGRLLGYIIAGHHAGLADASGERSSLSERFKKTIDSVDHAPQAILNPGINLAVPKLELDQSDTDIVGFQLAFFTRMAFSCLVDADFLATEQFMSPERAAERPVCKPLFQEMSQMLREALNQKGTQASEGIVKQVRQQVLHACREAALRPLRFRRPR